MQEALSGEPGLAVDGIILVGEYIHVEDCEDCWIARRLFSLASGSPPLAPFSAF